MATKEATIGQHTFRIGRFSALKGEVAGLVVSRVTTEAREVFKRVEAAERDWNERNKLRITRDECAERASNFRAAAKAAQRSIDTAPDEMPEVKEGDTERKKTKAELRAEEDMLLARADSWDELAKDAGDRQYVELPNPDGAPEYELILAGFEMAMQMAPEAVKRLIAVVTMSDGDLIAAYKAGNVEETLHDRGVDLFAEGDIGEILDLCVITAEVLEVELAKYRGPFGELKATYNRLRGRKQKQETTDASASTTSSPSDSPTGSTSSPVSTTGDRETSPEPVGVSSSPSATG